MNTETREALRERTKHLQLDAGPLGRGVCALMNAVDGNETTIYPDEAAAILALLDAPEREPDGWVLRHLGRRAIEPRTVIVQRRADLTNELGVRIGTHDIVPVYLGTPQTDAPERAVQPTLAEASGPDAGGVAAQLRLSAAWWRSAADEADVPERIATALVEHARLLDGWAEAILTAAAGQQEARENTARLAWIRSQRRVEITAPGWSFIDEDGYTHTVQTWDVHGFDADDCLGLLGSGATLEEAIDAARAASVEE